MFVIKRFSGKFQAESLNIEVTTPVNVRQILGAKELNKHLPYKTAIDENGVAPYTMVCVTKSYIENVVFIADGHHKIAFRGSPLFAIKP